MTSPDHTYSSASPRIGASPHYLSSILRELCSQPTETEWVEFKVNDCEPDAIGEYVSALANGAALVGKSAAYLVWGVRDHDREVVGTSFRPATSRVGNEELENWLLRLLEPRLNIRFHSLLEDGKTVVLLEIPSASVHPIRFKGQEFVRVGSYRKKLRDFPEKERELWRTFERTPFERQIALNGLSAAEVLSVLDAQAYFTLLEGTSPSNAAGVLEVLEADHLIERSGADAWNVTNLGAVLLAQQFSSFSTIKRKAIRVIQYRGTSRVEAIKERVGSKGYAASFPRLIRYINGLLPTNEVIGQALRESVPMFPELAIRELVANALIHQDFSIDGAGPMVEIFDDRVEITNPGTPLVDAQRFVDSPPRSRNEALASLMRRFRICEERGSGIDKVVSEVEFYQLPAPLFEVPPGSTRCVLFGHKDYREMDSADRIRACYLHACLCYVTRRRMTNSSVRKRFGIADQNAADASRLLKEAVLAGQIVVEDPSAGTRSWRYLPFWAAQ